MPTPFTHLEITRRLLIDPALPAPYRDWLKEHIAAFQLGAIAADARVANGVGRETTHFFAYDQYMLEHPAKLMLDEYPALKSPHDDEHRAFIAGYVGHLATDEAWALKMVRPNFFAREWEGKSRADKFLALHLILIYMDERDEVQLEAWQAPSLLNAQAQHWLPFMSDAILCDWRDLVGNQIMPGGHSLTTKIFGDRILLQPQDLRLMLDDDADMLDRLWNHVPKACLSQVEEQIYAYTRDQICWYLTCYSV